ncbi:MAG: DUF481 domain-containing protein [Acidobacteriota bacterium]
MTRIPLVSGVAALVLTVATVLPLAAAETPPPIWDLNLGLAYLATTGNSKTSSLGLDSAYVHNWRVWKLEAGALARRSDENGALTSERYSGTVRGTRALTSTLGLTAGLLGERDRFSGLDLRGVVDLGLRWTPINTDRYTVEGTPGLTYNHEEFVIAGLVNDDYLGGLLGARATAKLSPSSSAFAEAQYIPDFEHSRNYRMNGKLGAQANLTSLLALKAAYEVRYTNEPVPGFGKTDTAATVSLVFHAVRPAPAPAP